MLDGKQLRKLFYKFNVEYFGGRLPSYSIRSVSHIRGSGTSGICRKKRRIIEILRGMDDANCVSALLHEMAHAATDGGHGNKWKAEMIRLREAGAPFTATESRVRMEDWSGRVTKAHFASALGDALSDDPNLTIRQAIRWFIETEGGPPTIAAFLRSYPWATQVFAVRKKQLAEEVKRVDDFLASQKTARPA